MDQIGKYEILDKIGTGGFAIVYKGYDPFIKRPVAIKVCYSGDPETRERFYREAEIAGLLVHRNITTVYDFGTHEENPYLVEEYLPGEDLAHMIRRHEPETLAEKLDFLIQITSGLGYAHSRGVIHRDVKPGNVRVLESGRIKIMDFGTAKLAHAESNLTQTGMTLGTVAYLSPDRLLGEPAKIPSDVFSFGVLAYELLSFRRPFTARNIPTLIDQVLNAAPIPLRESWPDCPPELADIVHRCLHKKAEERYESCEALQEELERIRAERYAVPPTPTTESGTSASSTSASQIDVQLAGILERARQVYERGKYERAEVLLDEVLEIDPDHGEAKQLIAACREARRKTTTATLEVGPEEPTVTLGAKPAGSATALWEGPDERRTRRIAEAVASIHKYVEQKKLVQAAEALKFATDFLGPFEENAGLRERIVDALQKELVAQKGAGLRQARRIVHQMQRLREKQLLPLELAETFAEWVSELDPEDLAARDILENVRQDARLRESGERSELAERKKREAVESIEKLLAEGNPEMAEEALKFAVRLFGEFDQVPQLQSRITEALRDRG